MKEGVNSGAVVLDNNRVAFKEPIGFVTGQKEAVVVAGKRNRCTGSDFSVVQDRGIVGYYKFSQSHEREEACEELGNKEKVVVGVRV